MRLISNIQRTRRRLKHKLASKVIYFSLSRLLLFHFWFRMAFVVLLVFILFLALYLPKIWTVSPPGFNPVIKVSGLDLTQAWSLRRSALKAAAAGQTEQAVQAWRAAFFNNQADPDLVRGLLQSTLQSEKWPSHLALAVQESFWLLRLTQTNLSDLELTTRVLEKYQLYEVLQYALAPLTNRFNSPIEAAYLRSLFYAGQKKDSGLMKEFDARWRNAESRFSQQTDMQLYRAAYLAGWGPAATRSEGRKQLEAAAEGPSHRVLANRLILAASVRLEDAERYERSLKRLEEMRATTILDYINYWELLASPVVGRKAEALQLAKEYAFPPTTAFETMRLAEVYVDLGLRKDARDVMQRYTPEFGYLEGLWILYSSLLIQDEQWETLLNLAHQMRQEEIVRSRLIGYSYYLEGRAEKGLNRPGLAAAAFQKVIDYGFDNKTLGMSTAAQLAAIGYPELARDLLIKLKPVLEDNPTYWGVVVATAHLLKQPDLMLTAAANAYRLNPEDMACRNNYAAALLVNRTQPEVAVTLTMDLLAKQPRDAAARINHSLALAMNERPEEARKLMDDFRPEALRSREERNAYYLVLFEINLKLHQWDQARAASDLITTNLLFSNQVLWLEQARRQLPPKPPDKS